MGPTHNNQNGLRGPKKGGGGSVKITTPVPTVPGVVDLYFTFSHSSVMLRHCFIRIK